MHPRVQELRDDAVALLREAAAVVRQHRVVFAVGAGLVAATTVGLWPHDPELSRAITADRPQAVRDLASGIRRWGAFIDTLVFCGALYAAGAWANRRRWRTLAVAAFMSACLGGATVNVFRFTLGRPRPRAELPDRFTGPTLEYRLQSFPSGHSGTSVGGSAALLVGLPPLGIPAMLSAGSIVWASVYSRNHYVTDVLVGSSIGLFYGVALGLAARRLGRRARP